MTQQVERLLQGYRLNALQTIAKLNDLEIEASSRHEYAHALAYALVSPDRVNASLKQLDSLERLTLEHLLLQRGQAKTDIVKQELSQSGFFAESPAIHYVGSPYRQMPRYFEDVMARLTALGLVFSEWRDGQQGNGLLDLSPGPRLVIPEELRQLCHGRPGWIIELPAREIVQASQDTAEVFQRDIFFFWSYVHRNQVLLTSSHWIPKRHWSRINDTLWGSENLRRARTEGETGRLYFMRLLMEEMNLLEQRGSELVTPTGSRAFLGLSIRARTERALRAWMRSTSWNELTQIPELHLDSSGDRTGRQAHILRNGRQFVVGLLRHLPCGAWIAMEDLISQARKVNPEFLLPHHGSHSYASSYHGHNSGLALELPVADGRRGWDFLEAKFIAHVLTRPLHWLGVVELGQREGRAPAIRIPSLGAQILGIVPPEPEQLPQRRIIVQPNFQIFALDPISDHTLSMLDDFAQRLKGERVFEYRLTRESVYEAQQRGMTVSEIIRFLDRESSAPVPQNVKLSLQEWGRYHERIVVYQGVSLCQVADSGILNDLMADKRLSGLLGRRIAPHFALVQDDSPEHQALRRALQGRGLLPTWADLQKAESPEMEVQPDGRVLFRHPVPDFHLLHKLEPLAEDREGDLWLTEASISGATDRGGIAARIIDLLTLLQGRPLDPNLVRRIKVWGKHYGHAALEKVTLLQVKNAQILQELLQDPDIGPLIKPFSSLSAVAIVRDEDVPRLCQALRQRNMDLADKLVTR